MASSSQRKHCIQKFHHLIDVYRVKTMLHTHVQEKCQASGVKSSGALHQSSFSGRTVEWLGALAARANRFAAHSRPSRNFSFGRKEDAPGGQIIKIEAGWHCRQVFNYRGRSGRDARDLNAYFIIPSTIKETMGYNL